MAVWNHSCSICTCSNSMSASMALQAQLPSWLSLLRPHTWHLPAAPGALQAPCTA
jgi:hypothetical protein